MKRKIAQALICASILSLMMTGCGNAVTASAEPTLTTAPTESGAATKIVADNGQTVGTSIAADKVPESTAMATDTPPVASNNTVVTDNNNTAVAGNSNTVVTNNLNPENTSTNSRTVTDPKTTTEPMATTEPKATTESTATAEPGATTEPKATTEPTATAEPKATTTPASTPADSTKCNHDFTIQVHNENYDSCTGRAYSAKVCTKCGYEEIIDDTGIVEVHSYGAGIWVSEPTCTESGEQYHVCSKCGKEEAHFFISPDPNNHDYVKSGETVMDAGCCNRQGIVQVTYSCTRCGDSYAQDEFGDYGDHCDSNGDGICDACGTVFGDPVPEQSVPEQQADDDAQSAGE